MNKLVKNLIKIGIISVSSLAVLLILLILFLSILFPNELVRKEIEKAGTDFLGTELKIEKLKFSIFSGFIINNLTVKQYGTGWSESNIINIGQINLNYRLLPLVFQRTISIKALIVKSGQINLERNKYKSNWDYFAKKFNSPKKDKIEKKPELKSDKKSESINKNTIPLNLDIKKIGLENFKINYIDSAFLNTKSNVQVSDLKLLAKNINIKKNSFFNLESGCKVLINSKEYLDFNTEVSADGKLKIFDDNTGEVSLTGPVDLKIKGGSFYSKNIKQLVVGMLNDYLGNALGPVLGTALKDDKLVSQETDGYFNNVLNNSNATVDNAVNKVGELLKSKTQIEDYKNKILGDYDKESPGIVGRVDKKIEEVDGKISPILDRAEQFPFVDRYINLGTYRDKVKNLKKEINAKKETLTKNERGNLVGVINEKINNNFPKSAITKEGLLKDFNSQIVKYKSEIGANLSKLGGNQLFGSMFDKLDFLDKKWDINQMGTTYYLGKKESEAKDLNINLKYLNSKGLMKLSDKYVDYKGDLKINLSEFKIDFLPVKDLLFKVAINGNMPDLKYSFIDKPDLKIDSDKINSIVTGIIKNYLSNNYSENNIMKSLLKNVPLTDVDINKIKESINVDKTDQLASLNKGTESLKKYSDGEIDKIIKEIKKKIPGFN